MIEAQLRHADYLEGSKDRSRSYTSRLLFAKAAARELKRIERLELEADRQKQREEAARRPPGPRIGPAGAVMLAAVVRAPFITRR